MARLMSAGASVAVEVLCSWLGCVADLSALDVAFAGKSKDFNELLRSVQLFDARSPSSLESEGGISESGINSNRQLLFLRWLCSRGVQVLCLRINTSVASASTKFRELYFPFVKHLVLIKDDFVFEDPVALKLFPKFPHLCELHVVQSLWHTACSPRYSHLYPFCSNLCLIMDTCTGFSPRMFTALVNRHSESLQVLGGAAVTAAILEELACRRLQQACFDLMPPINIGVVSSFLWMQCSLRELELTGLRFCPELDELVIDLISKLDNLQVLVTDRVLPHFSTMLVIEHFPKLERLHLGSLCLKKDSRGRVDVQMNLKDLGEGWLLDSVLTFLAMLHRSLRRVDLYELTAFAESDVVGVDEFVGDLAPCVAHVEEWVLHGVHMRLATLRRVLDVCTEATIIECSNVNFYREPRSATLFVNVSTAAVATAQSLLAFAVAHPDIAELRIENISNLFVDDLSSSHFLVRLVASLPRLESLETDDMTSEDQHTFGLQVWMAVLDSAPYLNSLNCRGEFHYQSLRHSGVRTHGAAGSLSVVLREASDLDLALQLIAGLEDVLHVEIRGSPAPSRRVPGQWDIDAFVLRVCAAAPLLASLALPYLTLHPDTWVTMVHSRPTLHKVTCANFTFEVCGSIGAETSRLDSIILSPSHWKEEMKALLQNYPGALRGLHVSTAMHSDMLEMLRDFVGPTVKELSVSLAGPMDLALTRLLERCSGLVELEIKDAQPAVLESGLLTNLALLCPLLESLTLENADALTDAGVVSMLRGFAGKALKTVDLTGHFLTSELEASIACVLQLADLTVEGGLGLISMDVDSLLGSDRGSSSDSMAFAQDSARCLPSWIWLCAIGMR